MDNKDNNIQENKMGRLSISLSKEEEDELRSRADKNFRSISNEVSYLLHKVKEIENKDKIK